MPKAIVYVSCADLDDMNVYVCLRKLSKSGEPMLNLNITWSDVPVKSIADIPPDRQSEVILYVGPVGILRTSHREIDQEKSMHENLPYHPHVKEQKILPGDVVRLEIGIWAMGVEYEAGQSVAVQISRSNPSMHFSTENFAKNKRRHFGGQYQSHVILPFTQPIKDVIHVMMMLSKY